MFQLDHNYRASQQPPVKQDKTDHKDKKISKQIFKKRHLSQSVRLVISLKEKNIIDNINIFTMNDRYCTLSKDEIYIQKRNICRRLCRCSNRKKAFAGMAYAFIGLLFYFYMMTLQFYETLLVKNPCLVINAESPYNVSLSK